MEGPSPPGFTGRRGAAGLDEALPPTLHPRLRRLALAAAEAVAPAWDAVDRLVQANCARVWAAFREAGVAEHHLLDGTGYGLDHSGREALDRLYARLFGAEAALVRPHFVSGTHALAACLFGVLRPGDRLVAVTGQPYDTLAGLIHQPGSGSLADLGVSYVQCEPGPGGLPDPGRAADAAAAARRGQRTVYYLQRSRGYAWRPALDVAAIGELCGLIRSQDPGAVTLVDNCYGELVELREPTAAGADLAAGSLIKNPGGGLAPAGGYVAGRRAWVELAANRLTAPGLGGRLGAYLGGTRLLFQGLYYAPLVVGEALKGACFGAWLMAELGFQVDPAWDAPRADIVQAVRLGSREALVTFCQGLQAGSPVNAFVRPEPGPLPGYGDPVLMAAGTFVQGASLELSADAPLRPPWVAYVQGGIALAYARLGWLSAAQALADAGLVRL